MLYGIYYIFADVLRTTGEESYEDEEGGRAKPSPERPGRVPQGGEDQQDDQPKEQSDERTAVEVGNRPPGFAKGIAPATRPALLLGGNALELSLLYVRIAIRQLAIAQSFEPLLFPVHEDLRSVTGWDFNPQDTYIVFSNAPRLFRRRSAMISVMRSMILKPASGWASKTSKNLSEGMAIRRLSSSQKAEAV